MSFAVKPLAVFSLVPRSTMAFAMQPLPILLTRFFFIAFMAFMAAFFFITFMAFIAFAMAIQRVGRDSRDERSRWQ